MKVFRFLGLVAALLTLVFFALFGYAYAHYKNRVYPNSHIAGSHVGGLSREELQTRAGSLISTYESHQFRIILDDATEPTGDPVTSKDLGVQFGKETAVSDVWNRGHTGSVISRALQLIASYWSGSATPITYAIDEAQLNAAIASVIDPLIIQPIPAKLAIQGDTVTISDPVPGLVVTAEALKTKLTPAIALSDESIATDIRVQTEATDSNVARSTLEPYATQLNALGDMSLTLKTSTNSFRPKRAELLSWFSVVQDDSGSLAIGVTDTVVSKYLSKNVKNIDLEKSLSLVLTELQGQSVKVAAGSKLGSSSITLIAKAPEPVTAGSYTLGQYEGKYIEVNLSEQKLYAIEGNTLVKVYRISSGKWSTPTPKGTFTVGGKSVRAYSKTHGLYMPYWMNFTGTSASGDVLQAGEYGLHELPEWPNGYKEGAAHLGTAVSHGCVRLGVGDAAEMYDWTPSGTQVIIH